MCRLTEAHQGHFMFRRGRSVSLAAHLLPSVLYRSRFAGPLSLPCILVGQWLQDHSHGHLLVLQQAVCRGSCSSPTVHLMLQPSQEVPRQED